MSYEPPDPTDAAPVPQPGPSAAEAATDSPRRRIVAILTACAVLALPIVYLILHHAPAHAVFAGMPAQAPVGVAGLEQLVRTSPTAANRINLSLAYINGNQPGRAIPVLHAVLAEDKNNVIAWNNLCVANTLEMVYNDAIDECNNAVRLAPSYQLAKNNLKWAEDERQKTVQALAALEQTAPAARNAAFYLNEGLDHLHLGDNDQAIKAWQRTLELDPRNALAANNIGFAYMIKKQPASAIAWFQKAITLDPGMQLAKNNLAWAHDEEARAK